MTTIRFSPAAARRAFPGGMLRNRGLVFRGLLFLAGAFVFSVVTWAQGAEIASEPAPAAVHNAWTTGAPMPTARQWPVVGTIGTNIYVVDGAICGGVCGGVVSVNEIYSAKTNKWTTGASDPNPRVWAVGAVVNGVLYVIGGNVCGCPYGQTNLVEAYDPVTDTWTTTGLAPMPTTRDSMSAVVDDNIIYVIGGYDPSNDRLTTVESYNPAANTWTEEAPMLVGKSSAEVGLLGKEIISAGGYTDSNQDTSDNEGYNATKNSWKTLAASPILTGGGCAWSIAGQFYNAGGGVGPENTLEAYSRKTNSWTTLASMPYAVVLPGSAEAGGHLYCFGGQLQSGAVTDYVQIYHP